MLRRSCAALSCLALLVAGCSSGNTGTTTPTPTPAPAPAPSQKIQHVVIIMQENRTFDNLFNGFPGADTVQSGMNKGVSVPLQPIPYE